MFILDGRSFKRAEIIDHYLQIAFTEYLWNEDLKTIDGIGKEGYLRVLSKIPIAENSIPFRWMDEFAEQENTYIKPLSIIKWSFGPKITINLNWPQSVNPLDISQEKEDLFKKSIQKYASRAKLFELNGGINGQAVAENDDAKGLWIVPAKYWVSRGWLDTLSYDPSPDEYENRLWGATLSEGSKWDTIDQYFLANEKNGIETTVCKIKSNIQDQLTEKLIGECLVRSIGLPGKILEENFDSFFTNWKAEPDIKSQNISDFDSLIIEIHLCTQIKQGMSRAQVRDILLSTRSCL